MKWWPVTAPKNSEAIGVLGAVYADGTVKFVKIPRPSMTDWLYSALYVLRM